MLGAVVAPIRTFIFNFSIRKRNSTTFTVTTLST